VPNMGSPGFPASGAAPLGTAPCACPPQSLARGIQHGELTLLLA